MRRVFVDTFYWVALLYRRDPWHARVTAFSETLMDDDVVFTTDAVFLELLAALSAAGPYLRHEAVLCVDGLLNDPSVRVVEVSRPLFLDGLALYRVRPDSVA
jgi:predicted nucleic acid-binding protein